MTTILPLNKIIHPIPASDTEDPQMEIVPVHHDAKGYCPHERINVYEHHRLVKCKDCQATLDPFDYLWKIGNTEKNLFQNRTWLQYEVKNLKEEIEKLKHERSKLRSQIRKDGGKC